MHDSFPYEALTQLLCLFDAILGKGWVVGTLGGVKPFGVHKVEAVSVSCNPDSLSHACQISLILFSRMQSFTPYLGTLIQGLALLEPLLRLMSSFSSLFFNKCYNN
jgi:hypothetical protein